MEPMFFIYLNLIYQDMHYIPNSYLPFAKHGFTRGRYNWKKKQFNLRRRPSCFNYFCHTIYWILFLIGKRKSKSSCYIEALSNRLIVCWLIRIEGPVELSKIKLNSTLLISKFDWLKFIIILYKWMIYTNTGCTLMFYFKKFNNY